MKECVNCGYESDSPYCPQCGQKLEVKRVSFKGIINEFLSKWIGFDTQFGRTIVGMTINPGKVVNSYLKGNRTKYMGPLGFLVVMTALLIISFDVFGLEVKDFLRENQSTFEGMYEQETSERQLEFQKKTNEFIAKNFRFFATILIPFWSVALWVFYRKSGLNYIERLVISTYLTSQGIWLTIAGLGIFALTGHLFSILLTLASITYYGFGLMKTYEKDNFIISLLKSVGSYLVSMLLFLLVALVLGLLIGIVAVLTKPELFQQG